MSRAGDDTVEISDGTAFAAHHGTMKRLSTIVALVGSLLTAGAFGVACSHQQRSAPRDPAVRPLGESTAMGPTDPTHELEVPQTNAPPVERVPTLSTPTQPTTAPITTVPAPAQTPVAPTQNPTAQPVPVPVTPIPPAEGTPPPAPSPSPTPPGSPPPVTTPPPATPPPPSTMPAPSVPPSMMPMQGADAGVGAPPPPTPAPRDSGVLIPRDASPTPVPVPRIDGGATPKAPR
jgi:hypothetical protein